MPKLLMVTTVAATLRAFLLPYAAHFKQRGWTVDAMSSGVSSCEECLRAFDRCHDVTFSRKPWELKNARELCARIREIVTEGQYDIVHVHTPVAAFVTRLALRKIPFESRPKVVYTAHGFHFFRGGSPIKNAVFTALERMAGDWTDHTITINHEDYDAALERGIVTEDRLSLLPGIGLDFSRYAPGTVSAADVENVRTELMLGKKDSLFLMVAEFNPGKRHKDAVRALAKTGRESFHLAFAGTGPLEDEIKRLSLSGGVASRVHFLGQRSDVPVLMCASRATILPSEREGLNRSVMESICLGVPVLGADARGIRDLVTTPDRGTLFPVGDCAALAAAMILRVDEPCPDRPQPDPMWSVDLLLKEHEKIYEKLMKE